MDTAISLSGTCPRKEIIIYKNTRPSMQETCDSIRHYCLTHEKPCRKILRDHSLSYQIDGITYKVYVCMNNPQDKSEGWMICCMSN